MYFIKLGGDFPSLTAVQNALVPGLDDPVDVSCRPRKISCYNCGSNKHIGPECKELSMEEMTKSKFALPKNKRDLFLKFSKFNPYNMSYCFF